MMHFTEPTPTPNPASGREPVYRSQQINILGWRTRDGAGQIFQDNLVFNMFQGEVSKSKLWPCRDLFFPLF